VTDLLSIFDREPWMKDALCTEVDTDLFFPDKGVGTKPAISICRRCTVAAECLDYALKFESGEAGVALGYGPVGIYGGIPPNDRRKLLRLSRPERGDDDLDQTA
jgi:WhiB family redox-sensing transcriptional regulator